MVSFEDFKKLGIKVARIKEAVDHPNADRLYVLKLDIAGEEREVVAGIKKAYKQDELKGRLVVVVDNLEPAIIRGVESRGMILAAQNDDTLSILCPDRDISTGAVVK